MKYLFLIILSLSFCIHRSFAQRTVSLTDYLENAKISSPQLTDYSNQAEVAQMENQKVNVRYRLPNIYSTANWMEAPIVNNFGYDEAISNGGLYSAIVGAKIPLLAGTFISAEQKQNSIQQRYALWNQQTSWRDLKMQVTEGYLLCYLDQENIYNIKEQIALLDRQIRVAQTLAQTGTIKGSDVLLLQIEQQKLTTSAANWYAQLLNNLSELNKLCGIVDTAMVIMNSPEIALSGPVITKSQFQRQFLLDSLKVQNQMDLFNLKYEPQISAYGDAGLNATSPVNLQHNFGFSVGLNFSLNIFDGNQKQITKDQTALKLNTISTYQKKFKDQQQQNLLNLKNQVDLTNDRIERIKRELVDYDKLIEVYQKELAQGDVSVNDYLVALRTYVQEKQNLIDQEKQKYSAINAYNYWNW